MKNITLEFISDRDLYQSYMPFMKNGGLFVQTTDIIELGTDINLTVLLPDAIDSSDVTGKVSWTTPVGVQNGTPAGIGVSFIDDSDNIRHKIDQAIGRLLNSSEPTLSM